MTKIKEVKELPGVGAATADKMEKAGFDTLLSVAVASMGSIIDATGMGQVSVRKVIQAARESLEMGFETGTKVMERREKISKLSTGSETFDKLMDGGIESGTITECYGEFGSGKTQIAHILAVNAILDGGSAIYIDTENTFRPERLKQIAKGVGLDEKDALSKVKYGKAFNSDHQMLLAEKCEEIIKKENVKIIIVDSLTAHFRAEFIGRGTLAERQQKLNKHMHTLMKLADTYNIVVYVTNQVMSKPDMFFGDPTQAIGGHVVAHNSAFRIYLRKGKKGSRVAKLVDAPNLPDGEVNFLVTEKGLVDV